MVETQGGRRLAVFFLVAAFLVFLTGRWLEPVHNFAATVAAPFEAAISGVVNRVGDGVSGVFQGERYRQQYEDLRKQYGTLLHQIAVDNQELRDFPRLQQMLHFSEANPHFKLLPARVIGNEPNSLAPYIAISKGSRDGVKIGMTVVDPAGFFVGAVNRVWSNGANVEEMLSPSRDVGARDETTQAAGVVEGVFASRPVLKGVTTSATLHAGDFVVTSGDWNLYPRGIYIGKIMQVHRVPTQPLQSADVAPLTDFSDLELVQVITNFVPSVPPGR